MISAAASETHDSASQESHRTKERHDGHFISPVLVTFQHHLDGNPHK